MPRPVSLGRAALARLVKQHGVEAVALWLRDIETAPVKRRRGRPKGKSYYDDTPLLQAAAARWRSAGGRCGGGIWPFLREFAGSDSSTRRLLRRLDEWGAKGCAERDIADFHAALCSARDERALAEFEGKVAAKAGGTRRQAHEWLAAMQRVIIDAIGRGETVQSRGWGTWYPAHGTVGFRPGSKLKAAAARSGNLPARRGS